MTTINFNHGIETPRTLNQRIQLCLIVIDAIGNTADAIDAFQRAVSILKEDTASDDDEELPVAKQTYCVTCNASDVPINDKGNCEKCASRQLVDCPCCVGGGQLLHANKPCPLCYDKKKVPFAIEADWNADVMSCVECNGAGYGYINASDSHIGQRKICSLCNGAGDITRDQLLSTLNDKTKG